MSNHLIVVDSNILVKWFIPERYTKEASMLRDDHIYGRVKVITPTYALLEFGNALRKYFLYGYLSENKVLEAYELLIDVEVCFKEIDNSLVQEAIKYSVDKHVTVYDAYYVVLAKKHSAFMYTADEKLLNKLSNIEQLVRHIKEYPKDRITVLNITS